jgi:hypothetical protein
MVSPPDKQGVTGQGQHRKHPNSKQKTQKKSTESSPKIHGSSNLIHVKINLQL